MGGQACVLYGGAEFSRDTDLAVLADAENLARFAGALDELKAQRIAVPPFEPSYLEMGLAVHFRCQHPDAQDLRIDVMSTMRGLDPFPALWARRTTLILDGEPVELLALPDLVRAKKTQRDKDWPMIARLLEAHYFQNRDQPTPERIQFWLREMRTTALLREVATRFPTECAAAVAERPLLSLAHGDDEAALHRALREEEERERAADRAYWLPLRRELERLRHEAAKKHPSGG